MSKFNIIKIFFLFTTIPYYSQINDSILFYLNQSKNNQARNHKIAYYYAIKAKKLAELQKDSSKIILTYINLADVLWYSNRFQDALKLYFKILEMTDSSKFTSHYAYALYGIGWIECVQKNKFDKLPYLERAVNIFYLIRDTANYSLAMNGIENTYLNKYKSDTTGKHYLEKSIEVNLKGRKMILNAPRYKVLLTQFNISLANLLLEKKLYDSVYNIIQHTDTSVLKYYNLKPSLMILKIEYNYRIKKFDECLKLINENEKDLFFDSNYQKIEYLKTKKNIFMFLKKYKESVEISDSIIKIYPLYYEDLIRAKAEDYEYAQNLMKKELSIKHLHEKNELALSKNKQKNIFLFLTSFAFILALLFLINTFYQKKKIQQLNSNLHTQKMLLEHKNHEITQSISYASRIQQALLLQNERLTNLTLFQNSFTLYIPKDIVSGDFYWIFKSSNHNVYLGVFDCTGHGVPGSFVSLMNLNLLQEAVKSMNKIYPDEILNYVREKIILLLNLDEYQKDGMDGTLFHFPNDFKNTRKAYYSAANNPGLVVTNSEIHTTQYDKMPVGKSINELPFRKFDVILNPGTIIYLSTDGFKDQFGGPKNKRLGSKKFRELLLQISTMPLSEQKNILSNHLTDWKGQNEQTDDVCILGIEC